MVVEVPPHLDHGFQDWLAQDNIGLMRRSPELGKLLEAELPRLTYKHSRGKFLKRGKLLEVLLEEQGYMVSKVRVASVLYNGYADPPELQDINTVYHRLRRSLQNPELLYRKFGVGLGVGLTDF